jgi:ribulose-phosphate 3-epimerase
MLPKIAQIDAWRRERELNFRLEVDGGIDLKNGPECRAVGVDTFVAGTSFFGAADKAGVAQTVAAW